MSDPLVPPPRADHTVVSVVGSATSHLARMKAAGRRALAAFSAAVVAVFTTVIRGYRLLLSPWLGSACRFEPTCSAYALQALEQHGAWRGTALAGWRILRCHPGCAGGCDPVPPSTDAAATSAVARTDRPFGPLLP